MTLFLALGITIEQDTPLNLDPGFDSKGNIQMCQACNFAPNIKCNPRNSGKKAVAPHSNCLFGTIRERTCICLGG